MDVTAFSNLAEAVKNVDFIFEAIIDNLEIKQWLYESMNLVHIMYNVDVCAQSANIKL